jgi:hypothetical protein
MLDRAASMTAERRHLAALIFLLLISVGLLTALLAGRVMAKRKHRSALRMILRAAIISITIYAVWDLDEPRSELIRWDRADQALIELRDSIRLGGAAGLGARAAKRDPSLRSG